MISKACQRKREKISSGIQFAHSVNKPTDAAAGQSVGNILKAQPAFYSKKKEKEIGFAHDRHESPASDALSLKCLLIAADTVC